MTKARLTAEQVADSLQQFENSVSNKVLYEKCEFGVSMPHHRQEQHAEGARRELKQLESTGAIVPLFFFTSAILLVIMLSKSFSACVMFFFSAYCVGYIRQFCKIPAKHIQEESTFPARSRRGAENVFYHFSWTYIALFVFAVGHIIVCMVWKIIGLAKHSL